MSKVLSPGSSPDFRPHVYPKPDIIETNIMAAKISVCSSYYYFFMLWLSRICFYWTKALRNKYTCLWVACTSATTRRRFSPVGEASTEPYSWCTIATTASTTTTATAATITTIDTTATLQLLQVLQPHVQQQLQLHCTRDATVQVPLQLQP